MTSTPQQLIARGFFRFGENAETMESPSLSTMSRPLMNMDITDDDDDDDDDDISLGGDDNNSDDRDFFEQLNDTFYSMQQASLELTLEEDARKRLETKAPQNNQDQDSLAFQQERSLFSFGDEETISLTSRDMLSPSFTIRGNWNSTDGDGNSCNTPSSIKQSNSLLSQARRLENLLMSQNKELNVYDDSPGTVSDDDLESELVDLSRSEALLRRELEAFQTGYNQNDESFYDSAALFVSESHGNLATARRRRSGRVSDASFQLASDSPESQTSDPLPLSNSNPRQKRKPLAARNHRLSAPMPITKSPSPQQLQNNFNYTKSSLLTQVPWKQQPSPLDGDAIKGIRPLMSPTYSSSQSPRFLKLQGDMENGAKPPSPRTNGPMLSPAYSSIHGNTQSRGKSPRFTSHGTPTPQNYGPPRSSPAHYDTGWSPRFWKAQGIMTYGENSHRIPSNCTHSQQENGPTLASPSYNNSRSPRFLKPVENRGKSLRFAGSGTQSPRQNGQAQPQRQGASQSFAHREAGAETFPVAPSFVASRPPRTSPRVSMPVSAYTNDISDKQSSVSFNSKSLTEPISNKTPASSSLQNMRSDSGVPTVKTEKTSNRTFNNNAQTEKTSNRTSNCNYENVPYPRELYFQRRQESPDDVVTPSSLTQPKPDTNAATPPRNFTDEDHTAPTPKTNPSTAAKEGREKLALAIELPRLPLERGSSREGLTRDRSVIARLEFLPQNDDEHNQHELIHQEVNKPLTVPGKPKNGQSGNKEEVVKERAVVRSDTPRFLLEDHLPIAARNENSVLNVSESSIVPFGSPIGTPSIMYRDRSRMNPSQNYPSLFSPSSTEDSPSAYSPCPVHLEQPAQSPYQLYRTLPYPTLANKSRPSPFRKTSPGSKEGASNQVTAMAPARPPLLAIRSSSSSTMDSRYFSRTPIHRCENKRNSTSSLSTTSSADGQNSLSDDDKENVMSLAMSYSTGSSQSDGNRKRQYRDGTLPSLLVSPSSDSFIDYTPDAIVNSSRQTIESFIVPYYGSERREPKAIDFDESMDSPDLESAIQEASKITPGQSIEAGLLLEALHPLKRVANKKDNDMQDVSLSESDFDDHATGLSSMVGNPWNSALKPASATRSDVSYDEEIKLHEIDFSSPESDTPTMPAIIQSCASEDFIFEGSEMTPDTVPRRPDPVVLFPTTTTKRKLKCRWIMCCCICLILLIAAAACVFLLVFFFFKKGRDSFINVDAIPSPRPSASPAPATMQSLSPSRMPSIEPTLVPTNSASPTVSANPTHQPSNSVAPSTMPSTSLPSFSPSSVPPILTTPSTLPSQKQILDMLVDSSPESEAALITGNSPQNKAFWWLLGNTGLGSYSNARLRQRFALATIFYATGGDSWGQKDLWLSDEDECLWFSRVSDPCGKGRNAQTLIHLALYLNNLDGFVPHEITLLSELETIDLGGGLSNFGGGKLTGALPSAIARLEKLKELKMANNRLQGSIPPQFGDKIQVIDLSNNQFVGPLPPATFAWLPDLVELKLGRNRLTGSLSEDLFLGSSRSLKRLELHNNLLTGPIPSSIQHCRNLFYIALDDNALTSLPTEMRNLQELEYLSVNNNRLVGHLADMFGPLNKLRSLQLSNNTLSGLLPQDLQNLAGLRDLLDLSHNNFEGPIPEEYSKLGSREGGVQKIFLNSNRLTGNVPDSFRDLGDLVEFRIDDNNLRGKVDIWVCMRLMFKKVPLVVYADCDEVECPCCSYCCKDKDCKCKEIAGFPKWTCP